MKLNIKRIKAERVANGLSQEDVAKALGMTRSSYSLKETGKSNWSIDNLINFCNLIGLSADEIGIFFVPSPFDKANKVG